MVEILKKEQDKEIENVIVEIEESISLFEIQEFDMDQLMIEYFSSVTDELQKLLESIEPEEKPLQEADSKLQKHIKCTWNSLKNASTHKHAKMSTENQ